MYRIISLFFLLLCIFITLVSCTNINRNKLPIDSNTEKHINNVSESSQPIPTQKPSKVNSNLESSQPIKKSNESESDLYKNDSKGFSLIFPQSWKSKYVIEENKDWVYIKHNSEVKGNLLSISFLNKNDWEKMDKEGGIPWPYIKLGKGNGYIYFYIKVGDIQYNVDDKKNYKEWSRMVEEINSIMKTFKIISKSS